MYYIMRQIDYYPTHHIDWAINFNFSCFVWS